MFKFATHAFSREKVALDFVCKFDTACHLLNLRVWEPSRGGFWDWCITFVLLLPPMQMLRESGCRFVCILNTAVSSFESGVGEPSKGGFWYWCITFVLLLPPMQMLRESGCRFVCILNTACHLLNLECENHLAVDFGTVVSHLYYSCHPCILQRESSFRYLILPVIF